MLVNFGKFSINLDDIILIRYGDMDGECGVEIEYKANNDVHELMFPRQDIEEAKEYYNRIMEIYYENKRYTKEA